MFMPRPRLSEDEKQAMRDRILEAAEAVALEKGARAVSSRAIAEKLGMSHMTLYTYFDNLDQVYEALQERRVHQLSQTLTYMTERARTEGADRVLREALLFLLKTTKEHPRLADMPIIVAARHRHGNAQNCQRPDHRKGPPPFFKGLIRNDLIAWGFGVITIGQEQGVFCKGDTRAITETVVGIVYGVILSWRVGFIQDDNIDGIYGRVVNIVMDYLVNGERYDVDLLDHSLVMVDDREKE